MDHDSRNGMLRTCSVDNELCVQLLLNSSDESLSDRSAIRVNDVTENRFRFGQEGSSLHVVRDRN